MKLPNGYGSVYKLSGKRRKPYIAVVTLGWDKDTKKQNRLPIGYFETSQLALTALSNYNQKPIDNIQLQNYTLEDIYNQWAKIEYPDKKIYPLYSASWKKFTIKSRKIADIKTDAMQFDIDNAKKTPSIQVYMKVLMNKLFTFAQERDIVKKNYATFIKLPEAKQSTIHKQILDEDIKKFWNLKDNYVFKIALCMIYTGCRTSEFLSFKKENVHIDKHYICGGMKTSNGRNRIIPTPKIIEGIIKELYNTNSVYLFEMEGKKITYGTYYENWLKIMPKCGLNYLPHDCRHTCASLLDRHGVQPSYIRQIIGHSGAGITEKVYTHRTIEELVNATYNLFSNSIC